MDWSRSERSERWVFFAWIRVDALQHHLAVGAEGVADAVALAQAKSPPHGLRHGGLIAISERLFHLPLGGAFRDAVGIRRGENSHRRHQAPAPGNTSLWQCRCIALARGQGGEQLLPGARRLQIAQPRAKRHRIHPGLQPGEHVAGA